MTLMNMITPLSHGPKKIFGLIFNAFLYLMPATLILGIIDFRFSNYFWESLDGWRWIESMAMFDLFSVFEMYVWVLFGLWVVMAFFYKEYRPDTRFRIVYLIMALIVAGLVVAKVAYVAGPESVRSFWFQALVGYVNPMLLFSVLVFSLRDKKIFRSFLMAWLWAFGIFGAVVLFQGLTGLLPGESYDYLGRLAWPYIDPFLDMKAESANWLSFLFGPTFILGTVSLIGYRGKSERWLHVLAVIVTLISFVILAMTKSYTGIVVSLLLFSYLLIVSVPRQYKKFLIVGLILLIVGGVASQVESRKFQILIGNDSQETSISRRAQIYNFSYHAFEARPLVGIGPGNYQGFFRENVAEYLGEDGGAYPQIEIPPHPHNLIINFWSDLGIFGLLAIILLYFTVGYMFFGKRDKRTNLMLFVLIYLLVHGLLDLPYGSTENSALFWIVMAMVMRHSSLSQSK